MGKRTGKGTAKPGVLNRGMRGKKHLHRGKGGDGKGQEEFKRKERRSSQRSVVFQFYSQIKRSAGNKGSG